jgi:hypothetical protein
LSQKFVNAPGDLQRIVPSQCSQCVHLIDKRLWRCQAFPGGIPSAILTNQFDHRNEYPGDHGIRFESIHGGGPNDGNAEPPPNGHAWDKAVALVRTARALMTREGAA